MPEKSDRDSTLGQALAANWAEWFGEASPPMSFVVSGTGRPVAQTSVTIFVLDDRLGMPRLAIKVNRSRQFSDVTRSEFTHQSEAFELSEQSSPGSVARPFALLDIAGDLHLVAEFVPTDKTWDRGGPEWRRQKERSIAAWIGEIHRASAARIQQAHRWDGQAIVDTFVEYFQPGASVSGRLGEAAEMARDECEAATTERLVHGDFWPGNWLFSGDSFTVIDWEHSHRSPTTMIDEYIYPLAAMNSSDPGQANVGPVFGFSDLYREINDLPRRTEEHAVLSAIWVAASIATRTLLRWGVPEAWSVEWARKTEHLARLS